VIKISDEGGGIARSQVDKIWSYLYTTANPAIQRAFLENNNETMSSNPVVTDHSTYNAPIAGLGYGLPISRSYCRYFGGDLDLMSMEGYGTDAFLYLKRLGDSSEAIPV
jgi:pyruvate dehydrogenase kinase 2/3/4